MKDTIPPHNLDRLDLMILKEMEANGRQPIAEIARKVGTSRANASRKLQRLLDQQFTRILSFTDPSVLGYRTSAIIGLQTIPSEIRATTEKLKALSDVFLVFIAAGRYDIVIQVMFHSAEELPVFLRQKLGRISSITATETMVIMEVRKLSFAYLASSLLAGTSSVPAEEILLPPSDATKPYIIIDNLDIMILKEMENNGRQSISDLAKQIGTSRAHASGRLQRLLDHHVCRIVAFTNPLVLGYRIFAMIGIKVTPHELDSVADKLRTFPNVYWVVVTAGRHDIVIWTMFPEPKDLSLFIEQRLGTIQGITSTETMIGLELRKMSYPYMASAHVAQNDISLKDSRKNERRY